MAADLNALLNSSKTLTSHVGRPELPSVKLSLDQIEAQSRRLVSRQPGTSAEADYLLAQANVNASALANSIAHLDTSHTFAPLHAIHDTDVAGYLQHAHEQNLISTIEEGRKETQAAFYRMLEDRASRDWEEKKRRVFEQLGAKRNDQVQLSKSFSSKSALTTSTNVSQARLPMEVHTKMMEYDRVISRLNDARLRGNSFPIVNALIDATSSTVATDPRSQQFQMMLRVLASITDEPPSLPSVEHPRAHVLNNTATFARKFAKVYLSPSFSSSIPSMTAESRDATELKKRIAFGARRALENQYYDVLERTIHSRPAESQLGGDPGIMNKIRAFLLVRFYREGEWKDRIQLVKGQPVWARLFYLVRTGHDVEALEDALAMREHISPYEPTFVDYFQTWIENPDRKLPTAYRQQLQTLYNSHMLNATNVDPFKLALFKLMGKLEPTKRSVAMVTTTTEDWMWWQLAMIDEESDENNNLAAFAETLLGFGERHFDGAPNQPGGRRGLWATILVMVGQFERAVAALWDHQDTEVEAVHLGISLAYHGLLRVPSKADTSDLTPLTLSPSAPPSLALSTIIWRYIRQFIKMDAREALQYVYCLTLSADQGVIGRSGLDGVGAGVGKEQVETAWEMVRRIIIMSNAGPQWEDLVGGFRADGSRFSGIIEQGASLLHLSNLQEFNSHILIPSAQNSQENDRIPESIKLYNLAGAYATVISVLASALGTTISLPSLTEKERTIERTASEVVRHYDRTNRVSGKEKDAVVKLLKIRETMEAKTAGKIEYGVEVLGSTDLVPFDNDISKITRRAEEFKDLHESVQRNLQVYLPLAMDLLVAFHQKVKYSMLSDGNKQAQLNELRKKSRALIVFAGMLKYRMSPDVYSYLARLDVEIAL